MFDKFTLQDCFIILCNHNRRTNICKYSVKTRISMLLSKQLLYQCAVKPAVHGAISLRCFVAIETSLLAMSTSKYKFCERRIVRFNTSIKFYFSMCSSQATTCRRLRHIVVYHRSLRRLRRKLRLIWMIDI